MSNNNLNAPIMNNLNTSDNIISIRKRNITQAGEAFARFMKLAEDCINDKTRHDNTLYKKCSPSDLEKVALNTLREVAPQTPFRSEQIELVAGARFPDIQAERYYGVEVKSTKSDSWTSTGSSIFENTRIEDVSSIYMFFGKLGGALAEFRLRPYQDCLSNIAVTHAPRYLIDMTVADDKAQPDIFEKMQVDYNDFRMWDERTKYETLKTYVAAHTPKDKGMPWWIGEEGGTSPMTLAFLSDASIQEKEDIRAHLFILCPEVFSNNNKTKYRRAALWLCMRRSLLCTSLRDLFTAGGQVSEIGNIMFALKPVPQIVNTLYEHKDRILSLLRNPDEALMADISEFWGITLGNRPITEQWMDIVQEVWNKTPGLNNLNIKELVGMWSKPAHSFYFNF